MIWRASASASACQCLRAAVDRSLGGPGKSLAQIHCDDGIAGLEGRPARPWRRPRPSGGEGGRERRERDPRSPASAGLVGSAPAGSAPRRRYGPGRRTLRPTRAWPAVPRPPASPAGRDAPPGRRAGSAPAPIAWRTPARPPLPRAHGRAVQMPPPLATIRSSSQAARPSPNASSNGRSDSPLPVRSPARAPPPLPTPRSANASARSATAPAHPLDLLGPRDERDFDLALAPVAPHQSTRRQPRQSNLAPTLRTGERPLHPPAPPTSDFARQRPHPRTTACNLY